MSDETLVSDEASRAEGRESASAPLQFENITVTYGDVTALSEATTAFESGMNVVLGPNGSGKTTLFRVGAGVLPPDDGRIRINGNDPFVNPGVKRSVAYLPHGTPLNAQLTVRENLEYWGRVHNFDAETREKHIERVAGTMDLTSLLTRPGTDLSRGQKQRVTIARCLLPDPSVIFLDEPTTGLDPTAAEALRDRLADLADEGRTLVYSTHNLYEAEMLADQLTIIRDGRIVTQGPKAALRDRLQGGKTTGVRLSCDATTADFEALGVRARREGAEWVVDLPPDRQVPDLVRDLVGRDVAIRAVRPEEATIEQLYREFTGGERDE